MTDVPPDDEAAPAVPPRAPGDFPPPPPANPPAFDDDALAAALEASYTQPVTIIPPAPPAAPAPAEPVAAPEPTPPPGPAPLQSPSYESEYEAPDVPEYVVPPAPPTSDYVVPPAPPATDYEPPPPPDFDSPAYDAPSFDIPTYEPPSAAPEPAPLFPVPSETSPAASGPSTLDAIQRLQDELERRGLNTGEQPIAPAAEAPEPAPWEPALDHPAPGHVFPNPYQPFTSPTSTTEPPAAPSAPEPPSHPEPPVQPDVPSAPEPTPPPSYEAPTWDGQPAAPPSVPAGDEWTSAPPPAFEPPPLVDPLAADPAPPTTPAPPSAPAGAPTEGATYVAPTVPPPLREVSLEDLQGLAPPVGQQAAPLPPYDPNVPTVAAAAAPPAFGAPPVAPPPSAPPFTPSPGFADPLATAAPPVSPGSFTGEYASPVLAPDPTPPGPDADAVAMGPTEPASLDRNNDAVDDIDRIFGDAPADGAAGGAGAFPSQPISTQRVTETQPGLIDQRPENHPVFVVEDAGVEPTALDLRAGRAARLFWLWFATNSSVLSLAVGAVLFTLGMSLRQAIVATLAGIALSFLPLGLGTLAGKWSGQPTMVVSRATFGHVGNILPALLAVLTRVFWGAVLLWLLGVSVARLLVFAGLDAGLGEAVWTYVVLGLGFVIAGIIALFGYGFVARMQLILSILSGLLVAGLIYLTLPRLDLSKALAVGDGSWTLVLGGAVIVFSFIGLAWVQSSSDVARYQRTGSSGAQSMLWATIGATLPPFALIVWGAMLAASDPVLATGLSTSPLPTIARLLPLWYPAPLLAAAGLGLLSSIVLAIYSGGFALQSLGLRAKRHVTSIIAAVLIAAVAAALVLLAADAFSIVRDVATTLAVPVAAWAGIFSAEMMIRTRRFDSPSLVAPGGVYPRIRIANFLGFLIVSAIGFGLSSATFTGLTWQGYLFPLLGISADDPLVTSDVGVLVALALGIIIPLATAIPAIRRQERDSLYLEHTGPIPRITGSIPRQTGSIPRQTGSIPRQTGTVPRQTGAIPMPPAAAPGPPPRLEP